MRASPCGSVIWLTDSTQVGRLPRRCAVAVGPADQEDGDSCRSVARISDCIGERGARKLPAALVEHDTEPGAVALAEKTLRLLVGTRLGAAGAALGDLDEVEGAEPDRTAGRHDPLGIALIELALRSILKPADRADQKTHRLPSARRARSYA